MLGPHPNFGSSDIVVRDEWTRILSTAQVR